MKTTVDLPDELLIAAKKRAAETRGTLRELIEAGPRTVLADRGGNRTKRRKKIRWITVKGGLPRNLDVSDRTSMHEWLRRHQGPGLHLRGSRE